MTLDRLGGDGKAETSAPGLGVAGIVHPKEGQEQPGLLLHRHARAVIPYGHHPFPSLPVPVHLDELAGILEGVAQGIFQGARQ